MLCLCVCHSVVTLSSINHLSLSLSLSLFHEWCELYCLLKKISFRSHSPHIRYTEGWLDTSLRLLHSLQHVQGCELILVTNSELSAALAKCLLFRLGPCVTPIVHAMILPHAFYSAHV